MTENSSRFARISDIVVIMATIGGGAWAVAKFTLSESDAARLQYEKKLASIKAYGVQIDLHPIGVVKNRQIYVTGSVDMMALGIQQLAVNLRNTAPFKLVPIDIRPDGQLHPITRERQDQFIVTPDGPLQSRLILVPGRKITLPFVFRVGRPGFYLLQFQSNVSFAAKGPSFAWGARAVVWAG